MRGLAVVLLLLAAAVVGSATPVVHDTQQSLRASAHAAIVPSCTLPVFKRKFSRILTDFYFAYFFKPTGPVSKLKRNKYMEKVSAAGLDDIATAFNAYGNNHEWSVFNAVAIAHFRQSPGDLKNFNMRTNDGNLVSTATVPDSVVRLAANKDAEPAERIKAIDTIYTGLMSGFFNSFTRASVDTKLHGIGVATKVVEEKVCAYVEAPAPAYHPPLLG